MSAFARGMQLGHSVWNAAEDNRVRREELAMRKAAEARAAELHGLQVDGLRRAASRENRLAELGSQMGDLVQGVDRQATNANLDADFEQAVHATGLGLQPPAMVGGSNAANEAALTVRRPVDVNSPEFQSQMAGLRAQHAITSGNMADLDNVMAGERTRITAERRRGEAQRLRGMPNEDIAKQFGQLVNPRADVPAMVGYDPKSKRFTFTSDIPGFPSQVLTRAEMEAALMGLWEQGNGDYNTGLNMVLSTVQAQRGLDGQNFDRSLNFAKGIADLDLRNAELGLRTRETDARIGAVNRPQWQPLVGANGELILVDLNAVRSVGGVAQLPEGVRMPSLPQTLSDQEKVAYKAVLEHLAQLPPDAPQAQVDATYARFGLDPRRFGAGAGGLPTTSRFGGAPAAPTAASTAAPTPAPAQTSSAGTNQGGLQSREQRLRELYDNWQRAKGPWYLPTPRASAEAEAAERAYLEYLRNPNAR